MEQQIDEVETRLENIRQQKFSGDSIYQFLLYFDKLYDKFSDGEKKEFMNCFVESIEMHENEQPDGRFLKRIKFRFPVFFDGQETQELRWDEKTTLESVALLRRV